MCLLVGGYVPTQSDDTSISVPLTKTTFVPELSFPSDRWWPPSLHYESFRTTVLSPGLPDGFWLWLLLDDSLTGWSLIRLSWSYSLFVVSTFLCGRHGVRTFRSTFDSVSFCCCSFFWVQFCISVVILVRVSTGTITLTVGLLKFIDTNFVILKITFLTYCTCLSTFKSLLSTLDSFFCLPLRFLLFILWILLIESSPLSVGLCRILS